MSTSVMIESKGVEGTTVEIKREKRKRSRV